MSSNLSNDKKKKTMRKNKKMSLHFGSPNHELSFKLFFFSPDQLVFPPKDAM
jgi:hypothetical protein